MGILNVIHQLCASFDEDYFYVYDCENGLFICLFLYLYPFIFLYLYLYFSIVYLLFYLCFNFFLKKYPFFLFILFILTTDDTKDLILYSNNPILNNRCIHNSCILLHLNQLFVAIKELHTHMPFQICQDAYIIYNTIIFTFLHIYILQFSFSFLLNLYTLHFCGLILRISFFYHHLFLGSIFILTLIGNHLVR